MTKGCYTCRRRRIVCDNGLPTCRKCRDAGKECLGYQKPLVWVKGGVASRGRMMGRTFDDIKTGPHDNEDTGTYPVSSTISDTPTDTSSLVPDWQGDTNCGAVQPVFGTGRAEDEGSLVVAENTAPVQYLPTPWGLVDPLLKDLSPLSRFYIYHCMLPPSW